MSIELNQRTVNSLTLRRGGNLKEELKLILAAEAETEKLVSQDHPIARGATFSFLSWLTFWWVYDLLVYFRDRIDDYTDGVVNVLNEGQFSSVAVKYFAPFWTQELKRSAAAQAKNPKDAPRIINALSNAYGVEFGLVGIWKFLHSFFIFFSSYYLVRSIITWCGNFTEGPEQGYLWASLLFVAAIGEVYSLARMNSGCAELSVTVKSALSNAIYRKALRLKGTEGVSNAVDIIARDIERVQDGLLYFHYTWGAIPEILAVITFLAIQIGIYVLPAVGVICIMVPAQVAVGYAQSKYQVGLEHHTEERVGIVAGILDAIKIVKYNAWEKFFFNRIEAIRQEEKKYITALSNLRSVDFMMSFTTPVLVSLSCYALYFLYSGMTITAVTSFTVLAVSNALRYPLFNIPTATKAVAGLGAALHHIEKFLLLEEVGGEATCAELAKAPPLCEDWNNVKEFDSRNPASVKLRDVNFSWGASVVDEVRNVNFDVSGPHLMAIVGPLAAGKSSLITGICGQLRKKGGLMDHRGRFAFAAQSPFLFNATIRENILFGNEYEEGRYNETIRCCGLLRDLELFPLGDSTEVAERGTNLSGGQRQRVNLARAVYSNREIILLDDQLSALDQKVGRHIFTNCIKGLLKDRLVLFVTHNLQYLPACDSVLVMEDGAQVDWGTYDELMGRCSLLQAMVGHASKSEEHHEQVIQDVAHTSKPVAEKAPKVLEVLRESSVSSGLTVKSVKRPANPGQKGQSVLSGLDSPYLQYIRAYLGMPLWSGLSFLFAATYFFRVYGDFWVTYWTTDRFSQTTDFYLGVYGALIASFAFCVVSRGVFFSWASTGTAFAIHDKALKRLLHSTLGFFQATPLARLINIFSHDQETIDDLLPESLMQLLQYFPLLLATMIVIGVTLPITIAPSVALFIICGFVFAFCYTGIKNIRRHEAISRPYALSHVTATVQGLQTIRAMNAESRFALSFETRIDECGNYWKMLFHSLVWQSLQVDIITAFVLLAYGCLCVEFRKQQDGSGLVGPSQIGLIMGAAIQIVVFVGWCMRSLNEVSDRIIAVQISSYYSENAPLEAFLRNEPAIVQPSWPGVGDIDYEDAVLHYNPQEPSVLRNVSLKIPGGCKVGIVGRTGAGKSTLMNSLLRLFELSSGSIKIDGVDIRGLGLHDLREKISVIPQEPVLFQGTIRSNLDPFNRYTDAELWVALEKSYLKDFVTNLKMQLESPVTEYGLNLSVGQRQLLCIARILIRQSKLLVMDEATANVDMVTDQRIQDTVRSNFQGCTVLCIAHRLSTVIDFDRILVMEAGQVIEYGEPFEMLMNKGPLYNLIYQTGEATAAHLHLLAKAAYDKRRGIDVADADAQL